MVSSETAAFEEKKKQKYQPIRVRRYHTTTSLRYTHEQLLHVESPSLVSEFTLSKHLLALSHDFSLFGDIRKAPYNFLVAIVESIDGVGDANILAEFNDEFLGRAEVVARNTGVEMVDSLLYC